MPGPVAATRTVTALLSFAEICQRSKGYFVVMFNYCAEENVFKKQEQFNTTNDGESIKQTGAQTYKKERKKEPNQKKKKKTETEIEAIAKFRHSTRTQDELLSMTAFVFKNV